MTSVREGLKDKHDRAVKGNGKKDIASEQNALMQLVELVSSMKEDMIGVNDRTTLPYIHPLTLTMILLLLLLLFL